ncbi:NAD(P)/FAD-dependent oxidoreductase [Streptomyces hyderabadensis]|uniref:Thioredoxin-disulfide reductase n=1 Tax=Streptomyces hyderabadensis TaxID=598549 RepID=A0ABP9IN95_9ACTN|nr:FAD-dependent oxidoreductase [Streptomyces hyderabadensis]
MTYDVVVAGAGLAGLTAGLYTARFGLRTLVVEQLMPGGQVMNLERIENFPGFPDGISGAELGPTVLQQVEAAGGELAMDTIVSLDRVGDGPRSEFELRCESDTFRTRSVIVATGSSRRTLGVPGEAEFTGRGVSQCAACDGHFFAGKRVLVVGGGDSALDEARVLVDSGVKEVLVAHRGPRVTAQRIIADRAEASNAIRTLADTELVEVRGDGKVTGALLRQKETERSEAVDGVFVFAGLEPNTGWLGGLVDLDPAGHIVTDISLATSVPGVFAAGDVRQFSAAQLAASAGDGATAAVSAVRHLEGA